MIKTTRLHLRNFEITDTENCFTNGGQAISLGKLIDFYPMKNIREMDSFVRAMVKNKASWIICLKNGTPIGYVSMDIPYPQLGVGEKFQRNGYAQQAVAAAVKEYLLHRGLYLIEATCTEDTIVSQTLLKKSAFWKKHDCMAGE